MLCVEFVLNVNLPWARRISVGSMDPSRLPSSTFSDSMLEYLHNLTRTIASLLWLQRCPSC
uniref:Uncharacterized protein n=1 Tax=Physcomitrium patens TaxID=3218 RepID=A0A2K1IAR8_PHYPA|nr:hypothetical protein PHYPA_030933 [Physcomitrium patens]